MGGLRALRSFCHLQKPRKLWCSSQLGLDGALLHCWPAAHLGHFVEKVLAQVLALRIEQELVSSFCYLLSIWSSFPRAFVFYAKSSGNILCSILWSGFAVELAWWAQTPDLSYLMEPSYLTQGVPRKSHWKGVLKKQPGVHIFTICQKLELVDFTFYKKGYIEKK